MTIVLYEKEICSRYHAEIRQDKEQFNYTVIVTFDGKRVAKRDYTSIQSAKRAIKRIENQL